MKMRDAAGNLAAEAYPWDLLPTLVEQIELLRPEIHQTLNRLLDNFAETHDRLLMRKTRCVQTMSHCLRGSRRRGAASDEVFAHHMHALEQVMNKRSWTQVRAFMHQYIDELCAHARAKHRTESEEAVRQIRSALANDLAACPQLGHYAVRFGLSEAHLSREYRRLAGRSFRQERQEIRRHKAQKMLRESTLKIAAIASELGYGSTTEFATAFRRMVGMPPGAYRRRTRHRDSRD